MYHTSTIMKLSTVLANTVLLASSVVYADVDPIVIKVLCARIVLISFPFRGNVRTDLDGTSGFKILLQI